MVKTSWAGHLPYFVKTNWRVEITEDIRINTGLWWWIFVQISKLGSHWKFIRKKIRMGVFCTICWGATGWCGCLWHCNIAQAGYHASNFGCPFGGTTIPRSFWSCFDFKLILTCLVCWRLKFPAAWLLSNSRKSFQKWLLLAGHRRTAASLCLKRK